MDVFCLQYCESKRNKINWLTVQSSDCIVPADVADTPHADPNTSTWWFVPFHGHNSIRWQSDVWEGIAVAHRTG